MYKNKPHSAYRQSHLKGRFGGSFFIYILSYD